MTFLIMWASAFVIFIPALFCVDPKPANFREWMELISMLAGFTFFLSILMIVIYAIGSLF